MMRTLTWLLGTRFDSVALDDESHEWVFSFERQLALRVASPWRIRDGGGRIALGWEDHGQQFGYPSPVDGEARALSLLGGSPIIAADADEASADLSVRTEGGAELQVFNASAGYEGWQLCGEGSGIIVGIGGGGMADYDTKGGMPLSPEDRA